MLLFNPVTQKEGDRTTMTPTGLEGLLGEFNVKLGNDRIMNITARDPLEVLAVTNPQSPNPIAKAFHPSPEEQVKFFFRNVRTVDTLAEPTVRRRWNG